VAAPIRDKDEVIVAAIGISAPVTRFPPERCRIAAQQIAATAAEISAMLSDESAS